jgi:hypothetical protein
MEQKTFKLLQKYNPRRGFAQQERWWKKTARLAARRGPSPEK